jgi:hypothetical protein
MGYNLDSVGYSPVTRGWSEMWKFQLGIDFENRAQETPQIYVFHGGEPVPPRGAAGGGRGPSGAR